MHFSLFVVLPRNVARSDYDGFDVYYDIKFDESVEEAVGNALEPYRERDLLEDLDDEDEEEYEYDPKFDWYSYGVRLGVVDFERPFVLKNNDRVYYAFNKDVDWEATRKCFGGYFFTSCALMYDEWIDITYPKRPKLAVVKINDELTLEPVDKKAYDEWLKECDSIFNFEVLSDVEDDDIVVYLNCHK